jgi:hypothetical protein
MKGTQSVKIVWTYFVEYYLSAICVVSVMGYNIATMLSIAWTTTLLA